MLMNQVIVTVGYIKHHILMMKELLLLLILILMLMRMVMLGPHHLLLTPKLQHLSMRIRMFRQHECWARSGPVFGHEPARFVPNSTRITQRFWAHGPCPPLRRLIRVAMQTLPPISA